MAVLKEAFSNIPTEQQLLGKAGNVLGFVPARDETPLHGLDHPLMSVFFLFESAFHFFLNVGMATREKD